MIEEVFDDAKEPIVYKSNTRKQRIKTLKRKLDEQTHKLKLLKGLRLIATSLIDDNEGVRSSLDIARYKVEQLIKDIKLEIKTLKKL